MIRALRILCLTGGALLLPLLASAHNGEWLLAKCTIDVGNSVTLTVTADAEANPRIHDEAVLLRDTKDLMKLHYRTANGNREVAVPATVVSSTSERLDPAAPLGHTPEELAKTYRLLHASTTFTLPPERFTIKLPAGSPHTVVLWLVDERLTKQEPRWVMLIGGDESPLIEVNPEKEGRPWWVGRRGLSPWIYFSLAALAMAIATWVARIFFP